LFSKFRKLCRSDGVDTKSRNYFGILSSRAPSEVLLIRVTSPNFTAWIISAFRLKKGALVLCVYVNLSCP
jgi:hypothetical protein